MVCLLWLLTRNECRRLTIEEVSVIFDTGRLGSASAAAGQFQRRPDHEGGHENHVEGMESREADERQKAGVIHVERKPGGV